MMRPLCACVERADEGKAAVLAGENAFRTAAVTVARTKDTPPRLTLVLLGTPLAVYREYLARIPERSYPA